MIKEMQSMIKEMQSTHTQKKCHKSLSKKSLVSQRIICNVCAYVRALRNVCACFKEMQSMIKESINDK
jgi:hypothetical protein